MFLRIVFFLLLPVIGSSQINADFEASTNTGCGALQVVFIDKSISPGSPIVSWNWDLSGLTSDKQNPGRIFDKPGTYKICLTVTNAAGQSSTICKEGFITIYEKPEPNFIIDSDKGCVPHVVNFKDLSSSPNGKISSWTWDIGGSANVIKTENPNEQIKSTYSFAGLYSMSLTIRDEKGCEATVSKKDLLNIYAVPEPAINKTFLQTCELPWSVKLENLNTDLQAKYFWNLGNGQTSTEAIPPTAVFTSKGNYDLTLIVQKGECKDTFIYKDYVNTNPKKEIIIEKNDFCIGEEILFKDASELGADSVKWVFGDGSISNALNPKYTYQQAGCYKVFLYRWRGNCKDTLLKNCVNILPEPSPQIVITNQKACEIPVNVGVSGLTPGEYLWELSGQGYTKNDNIANTDFLIEQFGSYKLKLSFKDTKGCIGEIIKDVEIMKFEANLPLQFVGGCVPFQVSLGDSVVSDVAISQYKWEIGNPVIFTSTKKNPTFSLTSPGRYDVKLTVTNSIGCRDTVFREDFVQGGTPPIVDFIASPVEACLNTERTFTQNCSSNANYFVWNFGDMKATTGSPVNHTYGKPGKYDVKLIAYHNGCPASKVLTDFITVLDPVSNYEITYQCDDPYTVRLNNLSLGADSLYWVIGNDAGRDTLRDSMLTKFTFPDRGVYDIKIFSKNFTTGCVHEQLDTIIITDPVAKYEPDTTRGCLPLTVNFNNLSTDAANIFYSFNGIDMLSGDSYTYKEDGQQALPWMYVRDIHNCIDSFRYGNTVMVNAIKTILTFPEIACIPQEVTITHNTAANYANITNYEWRILSDTLKNKDSISLLFDKPEYLSIFFKAEDDWGCSDSIMLKDAIQGVSLKTGFTSDTFGCTKQEVLFVPKGDNVNTSGYKWTFGDGEEASTGVTRHLYKEEGIYDVCLTLYDIRGCENTHCEPAWIDVKNPVAEFSGDPLFETCPPLLSRFTNNSKNAIAYQWNFGDDSGLSFVSDPSHIYFEPDTFDVTLIAIRSNVCQDTMTLKDYVIVLGPKGKFDFQIEGNCTPLQVRFNASSDDYYRYYWDFGNGIIDSTLLLQNRDEKVISYDRPGVFSPKLIISDNAGCRRNFTNDDIIVNDLKLNVAPINDPICGIPSTIQLSNLSTTTSPATYYEWLLTNNTDILKYTDVSVPAVVNTYGIYDLILSGHTDNCSDTLEISSFASVHPTPKTGFYWLSAPCQYNSIDFFNTSFVEGGILENQTWKIDQTYSSDLNLQHIFEKSGVHAVSLVVTSEAGCTSESLQSIDILPNNKILAGQDTLICAGDSALLNMQLLVSAVPGSNSWSDSDNKICDSCPAHLVFPKDSIYYTATYTASNGCITKDSTLVIVAPEMAPKVFLQSDTTLCKDRTAILSVSNPNPNYTYEWKGLNIQPCTDSCYQILILPNKNGYYKATAFNQYGCSGKDSIWVKVETSVPDFLVNQKYICEDSSTLLYVTGVKSNSWVYENNVICEKCDTILVSPDVNAEYTVNVTSANGCEYSDKVSVNIIPSNSIDAGEPSQICLGEKIQLQGTGIGSPFWSLNNQTVASSFQAEIYPKTAGLYILACSMDECTLKDSVYIDVITKSTIEARGDTVCPGEQLLLSSSGLAYTYQWYYNGEKIAKNKEIEITADSSIYISVIGTRTTCIPDTQNLFIYVHPKIKYEIEKKSYDLFFNSKIAIKANYPSSESDYMYEWSPPTGLSCDACPEPVIRDLESSVIYTVVTTNIKTGCTLEQQINVSLKTICSDEGYYIPNVIYLNGNNQNEMFFTKAANPEEFRSITVRDRWGNIVYTSYDIDAQWDATFNGRPLESGVYTYVVQAYCTENDEIFYFTGDITLLK